MFYSICTLGDIKKVCHLKYRNLLSPPLISFLARMRCLGGRDVTSDHETCDIKTDDVEADDRRTSESKISFFRGIDTVDLLKIQQ